MKTLSALLILASLLILPATTQAKVLVYRGTLTIVTYAPPQSALPSLVNLYFLVDPDTRKTTSIGYFTIDGKKQQIPSIATSAAYFLTAPTKQGKTITALTFGGAATFTDAQNFNLNALVIYGTNSTIRFTNTGSTQSTNYPLLLKGNQQTISSTPSESSLAITRVAVTYQQADSIAINNASTTIEDATTAISLKLSNKGYKAP